jgi:DNA-binding CsgD family transcriptional regulator
VTTFFPRVPANRFCCNRNNSYGMILSKAPSLAPAKVVLPFGVSTVPFGFASVPVGTVTVPVGVLTIARGYLSTEDAPELLRAFGEISAGHPFVGASALPLILSNFAASNKNSRGSDINSLSDRELEIFSFIGRGLSVSELASELHVSVKTIETHQMRMKEKLAVHSAAELRQKAREWLARSAVNRIREDPESE